MQIKSYFSKIRHRINQSSVVRSTNLKFKEVLDDRGIIRGRIIFIDDSILDFSEYVVIGAERLSYRFHWQDCNNNLIKRWDNTPHHRELPNIPHHIHIGTSNPEPCKEVGIIEVLEIIEKEIIK